MMVLQIVVLSSKTDDDGPVFWWSLQGLTMSDLEDLLEDIRVYLELEQGKNADYWRDIITVTEDELQKLRKLDAASRG